MRTDTGITPASQYKNPSVISIEKMARFLEDRADLWLGPALHRVDMEITQLRASLSWALFQIDDDLDPDHQAAFAAAKALLENHK